MARALRGAGLESASLPILAREVLMRWESCLDTQSAGVLRAVFDGLISYLILSDTAVKPLRVDRFAVQLTNWSYLPRSVPTALQLSDRSDRSPASEQESPGDREH